jgi:DHA1 family bicyclomycin/chloramphenicol resistance-like MFS transporter
MNQRLAVLILCLGSIAAIGPFAIDMYISAMPVMAQSLAGGEGGIEHSMMSFLAGFCIGQLILGPVSDRVGRKPVALAGLVIFFIASIACALADDLQALVTARAVQGFGGSIGMVIAMSAIRDKFSGIEAARMMGFVVAILGIAPVAAPMVGGLIIEYQPWQVIFYLLAAIAAVVALLVLFMMPETRDQEDKKHSHVGRAICRYPSLLVDRGFMRFAVVNALTQSSLFAYIAGISTVLIVGYGVTSIEFSVVFGVNALGLIISSQLSSKLAQTLGQKRLVKLATFTRATLAITMCIGAILGWLPLSAFLVLMFFFVATMGLIAPVCSVLALKEQGHYAGTASALFGALGFGFGAVLSAALGASASASALPLTAILAVTCLIAAVLSWTTFGTDEVQVSAA